MKNLINFHLIQCICRTFYLTKNIFIKTHYDSLGITPKATQADIKSAYYKLSMMYHPDKNKNNSEANDKFRDITEAYEVLGNVENRKMYDKGLYVSGKFSAFKDDNDIPVNKFYKSRDNRSRPPVGPSSSGRSRTIIYDFDEWSKSHYGTIILRNLEYKKRNQIQEKKYKRDKNDIKIERIVCLMGILLLSFLYYFRQTNYDENILFNTKKTHTTFGDYVISDGDTNNQNQNEK